MFRYWRVMSSVMAVQDPVHTNALTPELLAAAMTLRVPLTLILNTRSRCSLPYRKARSGTDPAEWMMTSGLMPSNVALRETASVTSPLLYVISGFGEFGGVRSRTVTTHSGCCCCNAWTMAEPRKPVPPVTSTEVTMIDSCY